MDAFCFLHFYNMILRPSEYCVSLGILLFFGFFFTPFGYFQVPPLHVFTRAECTHIQAKTRRYRNTIENAYSVTKKKSRMERQRKKCYMQKLKLSISSRSFSLKSNCDYIANVQRSALRTFYIYNAMWNVDFGDFMYVVVYINVTHRYNGSHLGIPYTQRKNC